MVIRHILLLNLLNWNFLISERFNLFLSLPDEWMCKNSFYNTILSLYQHETKQLIKWTLWKVIPFKKFSSILILNTHSLSVYVLRYKNRNPLFIVGSYYDLKAFPTIKSPISEKLRNNSAHWYKILHKTIVKVVKRYRRKEPNLRLGSMKKR